MQGPAGAMLDAPGSSSRGCCASVGLHVPGCVHVLQVGQHAVESEDEEVALSVFDLFIDILEGSAQLLGPHLAALVQWCMAVASNTEAALDTRGQAAQVSAGQSCSRAAALECAR